MKKSVLLICILLISLLISSACSSNKATGIKSSNPSGENAEDIKAPAESTDGENMETVISEPDFAVVYDSLEKLMDKAEIIVEGNIMDTSYFDFNTVTYTKAHLKVTKTFNNNVKEGDVITLVEPGGITTKAAIIKYSGASLKFGIKPTEKDKNTKVRFSLMGYQNVKPNDKILIFGLQDYSLNVLPGEKYYVTLGAFQGKFNLSGNNVERFTPKSLKTDKYLSLNKNKLKIEQDIKNMIKSKQKTN
ncbi:MAG: hypothetical protein QME45_14240 [Clostridiales bacterium]|nr:hypothetical protein [Clostridiales bacterium]